MQYTGLFGTANNRNAPFPLTPLTGDEGKVEKYKYHLSGLVYFVRKLFFFLTHDAVDWEYNVFNHWPLVVFVWRVFLDSIPTP